MNENESYYFDKGYDDQCWGYPILDHAWGYKKYFWNKAKYPKKYQKFYRLGQVQSYLDGQANCPWFYPIKPEGYKN